MQIIKASKDLTNVDVYKMTKGTGTTKVSDYAGLVFTVDAFVVFEDVNRQTGQIMSIASIRTADGKILVSNSPTFVEAFNDIVDIFGENIPELKIVEGKSKAGRTFYNCDVA